LGSISRANCLLMFKYHVNLSLQAECLAAIDPMEPVPQGTPAMWGVLWSKIHNAETIQGIVGVDSFP